MTYGPGQYQRRQEALDADRFEEAWAVCAHCKTPYVRADLRHGNANRLVCAWHHARGCR